MKAMKFVCIILSVMLLFCTGVNVHADEEEYEEWDEDTYWAEYFGEDSENTTDTESTENTENE